MKNGRTKDAFILDNIYQLGFLHCDLKQSFVQMLLDELI